MWDQLPNSGNARKFMIPNYSHSGWTNYSWVISQKMIEKEMGNRGSKLKKVLFIVNITSKEQRVDGSWQLLSRVYNPCLRFTLMGYKSNSPKGLFIEQRVSLINHQIKFLSNQIDMCIKYNTIISPKPIISSSLNPWFLTGFSEADSSFSNTPFSPLLCRPFPLSEYLFSPFLCRGKGKRSIEERGKGVFGEEKKVF